MPQATVRHNKLTPNLIVSSVERSLAFYRDVLGFQAGMTVPDQAPFAFASVQSGLVEIFFNAFRFTLGGRVDKFGNLEKAVFSPRITAMYKPLASHSIRVSFNRAFRAPSVINNYLDVGIKAPGADFPLGAVCQLGHLPVKRVQLAAPIDLLLDHPRVEDVRAVAERLVVLGEEQPGQR